MYETKPYLRNPKIRLVLWLSMAFFFGLLLLVGYLDESQHKQVEALTAVSDTSNASTATARETIYQVWEVTRSYEDQQLSAIVERQRGLIEKCQQFQSEGKIQVPDARPSQVVLWLVREDGEIVNKLIWDKPQPPPYSAPSSCLTDPLSSFSKGEGGVVIISVSHIFLGYYIPEGAPTDATPDFRFPVYDVAAYFCMTDLSTQTIIGADKLILHPPSSIDYPGLPFMPDYAGDPPWRNSVEEWACNIPVSTTP